MNHRKLSVSIDPALADFAEAYRLKHGISTKSSVVERALSLLREQDLEAAYAAASAEVDDAWSAADSDGLSAEQW